MLNACNRVTRYSTVLLILIVPVLLLSFATHAQQQPNNTTVKPRHTIIRLPNVHPSREQLYNFAKNLLTEALEVTTPMYGAYTLHVSDQETPQGRQLRSLEHNLLDVTWSVSSEEREHLFLPIRIPIMAGLLGKRALLLKENDDRLSVVGSKSDLASFRTVLGYDWPDTNIFRANNIEVLETTYHASFRVVAEGFADIFPRGVLEVGEELSDTTLTKGLEIDKHIIISYPSPIFFFVNKTNTTLATRLSDGLLILFKSGRFKTLLESHQGYIEGLELINSRRVIEIDNPSLSEESQKALDTFLPEFYSSR